MEKSFLVPTGDVGNEIISFSLREMAGVRGRVR
jgi:hypothetical protein